VLQFAVTDAGVNERLDPLPAINQHQGVYANLLWEPLLDFDEDFNPKPLLATMASANEASTVWTFRMRSGVKWHDGKPFTSGDVAWTLKRILNKSNGSPFYAQVSRSLSSDGLDSSDPAKLVCRLKSPDSLFPLIFMENGMQIVQDGWEPGKDISKAVGTGPFKVKSWRAGAGFEFVRNPSYWRGAPYLDGARSVIIPDPASKLQSVLAGPSYVSDSVSPAQLKTAKRYPVEVVRQKGFYHTYFTMDTRQKPFDNPDVRMAMKLAADRESILKTAYGGYGILGADCSAPVGDRFFPTGLKREYDVATAKSLLAKAGYPNGLDLQMIAAPVMGAIADAAVVYANAAKQAGIRISIKQWPVDTYFDQVWLKKPFYVDYLVHTHPLRALQLSFVSDAAWNETFLRNTVVDRFVAKGLAESNDAKRLEISHQAMAWQAENEGIITPAFHDRLIVRKSSLMGANFSSTGRADYSKAWIAR
jgi:peptide/nickel transport system substrate-binding protein